MGQLLLDYGVLYYNLFLDDINMDHKFRYIASLLPSVVS